MDTNYILGLRQNGEPISLTPEERRRHIETIGKTGTGKSSLLYNLMCADFGSDRGFAFIDPHGDQAATIADATPKHRINDVIYLDAADLSYSVGWNPLERVEPDRRSVVAAQISQAFAGIWRLSTAETPRLLYILDMALRLLLDNGADPNYGHEPGVTLLSLPRLLIDDDYRERLLKRCADQEVRHFWEAEFASYTDRYRQEAIAPIQNKVGQLVSNPFIRAIIGQPKSTISIRRIMDEGKILIVNLSKGRMGAEPAHLLGALLVSAFAQAAESRADTAQGDRRDFTLYVDEFQNFATDSFADILSEARKWGLALCLSHQFLYQLPPNLRQAVLGNVGTLIAFRVGAEDAAALAPEFGLHAPLRSHDLTIDDPPLSPYCERGIHAPHVLMDTPDFHVWIKRAPLLPEMMRSIPPEPITGWLPAVRARTHARHARPRAQIERLWYNHRLWH
jgi:type IV secretory pathway TraG/TraD family ATPase VirD4